MTHWDQYAAGYDAVMDVDPTMAALRRTIVAAVPARARRVLDLGTGTGALLSMLRKARPDADLIGLDPSQAMLDACRRRLSGEGGVFFVHASAHRIPLDGNSVDAVISNFALHHLEHPDKVVCAAEVFRVLRPGGVVAVGDQFCHRIGTPDDPAWVEEMFDLLCVKARHYLRTAGLPRMLLQIELMPRFLRADGELPVPVAFWRDALVGAGFPALDETVIEPAELLNRVVMATRPW